MYENASSHAEIFIEAALTINLYAIFFFIVGSVISPKVNMPLRSKTTRSSYHQKSLTGFLSHEDQKRFQSKLRSKTSPSAK